MIVIPAIDIIDGKCVRLLRGDYDQQTTYSDDPAAMAVSFEKMGVERLHLVDLDGAKKGSIVNAAVLKRIASQTKLSIDFGGGVSSEEDIKAILDAGADMITIGSLAVKQPGLLKQWIAEYGADKFFIGADVMNEQIKIRGWLEDGGIGIIEFIGKMINISATRFFCTDIKMDGAMQGPSIQLYQNIISSFPGIRLTASGGVTSIKDLDTLKDIGCEAAIVGKALYEKTISTAELTAWIRENNNRNHAL